MGANRVNIVLTKYPSFRSFQVNMYVYAKMLSVYRIAPFQIHRPTVA